ncbi:hypothetical protein C8R43DRAFT_1079700 [Mycena crocata]|nr:hypothetical protein C8R43DRAFT_1079700 [Mycena crocata]
MPTTTWVYLFRILKKLLLKHISWSWLWFRRLRLWLYFRLTGTSLPAAPPNFACTCSASLPTCSSHDETKFLASQDNESKGTGLDVEVIQVPELCQDQNQLNDNLQQAPPLLSSIPGIFPTAPDLFERYERGETIVKQLTTYIIQPRDRSFARKTRTGWTEHVHPEGALYYVHDAKRIFTDAHLYDDTVFDGFASFLHKIEQFLLDNQLVRNPNIDLVLDLTKNANGEFCCGYYFVDHFERIVFWDDPFKLVWLSHGREVHGVTSPQHVETQLRVQFWRNCELFPSAISLTPELIIELRDILAHNIGDVITSPTSTVPYPIEDLLNMLTVVEGMKENVGSDCGGSVCVLGRLMSTFTSQRFYHFHGEPCARLDKTQSVYGCVPQRSLLIKILSPLLFNAPLSHLRTLEDAYSDEIVSHAPWRRITEGLNMEWQELTLFATVLLNADMAFLAIPTVDNADHSSRSTGQIASYVSVVASLGSVIVGLILSRQNRDRKEAEDYIDEAADYLARHYESRFRFEPLAILYSLPFALLMWGTFAFLVAFLDMCFQASDQTTRALVASAFFVSIFGIIWCSNQGEKSAFQLIRGILNGALGALPIPLWQRTVPTVVAV